MTALQRRTGVWESAIRSSDQISIVDLTNGCSVNLSTDPYIFAGDTPKEKSTQSFATTF